MRGVQRGGSYEVWGEDEGGIFSEGEEGEGQGGISVLRSCGGTGRAGPYSGVIRTDGSVRFSAGYPGLARRKGGCHALGYDGQHKLRLQ